jgi:hypothetical protein
MSLLPWSLRRPSDDCACVLNMQAAVEAYTKTEVNLGGVVALAAGTMSVTTNMRNVKPI